VDINQAARMIEWLDEERRRDKQLIATLEQRLVQQQELVETVQRRLNSVESDQTVIRSEVSTSSRETDVLDQVRKEMRQMIEGVESKRLSAERELERRSELARENMIRPFRELEERLEKLARQTGEMPVLQYEGERLNTQVAQIQQKVEDVVKKLDEPERRIAVLEEQQRLNTRRISEGESEMPELKKQIESMRPKLTLLEDLALRNERRVQEINSTDRERREQIQQFIDQQTLLLQQRDQQIESLVKKFDEHDHAMERNMERFETWSEAYRSMKTIIDDFQRIGDRLERRINEVAEMQRLSEERFRQEWNNWRSDDQKRWKQFTLSNDEVWRSHDKDFERFVKRMEELQEQLKPLHDSMTRLWRLERDRAQLYRERYTAMLAEYDIPSSSSSAAGSPSGQPPTPPATSTSTGEMSIIKANGTPSSPTTP
jgi:chromosome segregation ATPase